MNITNAIGFQNFSFENSLTSPQPELQQIELGHFASDINQPVIIETRQGSPSDLSLNAEPSSEEKHILFQMFPEPKIIMMSCKAGQPENHETLADALSKTTNKTVVAPGDLKV
jgi:hypothetical protein